MRRGKIQSKAICPCAATHTRGGALALAVIKNSPGKSVHQEMRREKVCQSRSSSTAPAGHNGKKSVSNALLPQLNLSKEIKSRALSHSKAENESNKAYLRKEETCWELLNIQLLLVVTVWTRNL